MATVTLRRPIHLACSYLLVGSFHNQVNDKCPMASKVPVLVKVIQGSDPFLSASMFQLHVLFYYLMHIKSRMTDVSTKTSLLLVYLVLTLSPVWVQYMPFVYMSHIALSQGSPAKGHQIITRHMLPLGIFPSFMLSVCQPLSGSQALHVITPWPPKYVWSKSPLPWYS